MRISSRSASSCLQLAVFLIWLLTGCGSRRCSFPAFLYHDSSAPDSDGKIWLTRTWTRDDQGTIEKQREVSARQHSIVVRRKYHGDCLRGNQRVVCFRKERLFTWKCSHVTHDFYVVERLNAHGRHEAKSCVQFAKRSEEVVQLYEGAYVNGTCRQEGMTIDEWPWISSSLSSKPHCPIQGGYMFDVVDLTGAKTRCQHTWLPARMEMECLKGEGVDFVFPRSDCNPLANLSEMKMQCWSSWTFRSWTYILLTEDVLEHPRYMLRLPEARTVRSFSSSGATFTAQLYPVPVAPSTDSGQPSLNPVRLNITSSDRRTCADASPQCPALAQRGGCQKDHRVATFCKRSCNKCRAPAEMAECVFPKDIQGKWQLLERDRIEYINITEEHVYTMLGRFSCKGVINPTEYPQKHFKVIASLDNGCRARYLCLHLQREDNYLLNYRISRSASLDRSSDLCSFQDDSGPWGNLIRSAQPKLLINSSFVQPNRCGLDGQLPVEVTQVRPHDDCHARLSDWDAASCQARPTLSMAVSTLPCGQLGARLNTVYSCVAYVDLPGRSAVLLLSSGDRLFCWVIESQLPTAKRSPWKLLQHVPDTPCWSLLATTAFPESFPTTGFVMTPHSGKYTKPSCHKDKRVGEGVIYNSSLVGTEAREVSLKLPITWRNISTTSYPAQYLYLFCILSILFLWNS